MIKRNCLIVDNEDQSEEINKLIRDAGHQGIDLECHQFNVGNTSFSEVLTNGLIDIEKVKREFKQTFKNTPFDLVAFDWDLEDDFVTGVELIRHFTAGRLLRFSVKIVYSGVLDNVLAKIVEENLGIVTQENDQSPIPILKQAGITKMKSLIKNEVKEYLDRGVRDSAIIRLLKEDLYSSELIICQTLRRHPNFIFNNNFVEKKFVGKTFEQIADALEQDEVLRSEFKREIIEQLISYLTKDIA